MQDQRLGTILWKGKWLIAASVALAVALAILLTARAERVYQATAILQVASAAVANREADPLRAQEASVGLATTYATLLVDRSFLEQIRGDVGDGDVTAADLRLRLGAEAVEETALIRLRADGSSPEDARELASDVASAFVDYVQTAAAARSERQQVELQARIAAIGEEIDELRVQEASDPDVAEQLTTLRTARAALANQLASIVANGIEQGGSVVLTSPPTASAIPISPRPLLNVVSGIMLGLLVGSGLAFLRSRLDRGLHSGDEVEELLGAPVLAAIPVRRRFSTDDAVLGEAYDVLRANLAFIALDRPLQVLTLTSYNPREGKTSSVEGLAYAAVRGGLDVVVIDGDVRTGALSERLGYAEMPGLTSVVAGMATLQDVLIEVTPGLSLLPSGPTPPNPPSLLASARMRELIADLRDRFALVLVDSPPVAHLADAAILAAVSDGIVVVSRVGVTARDDVATVAANLRHSPTPIVGSILLEPRTIDETYYPAMSGGRPEVPDAAARP
ncbi:MAG TPA: polysaccharide biosynthesis tyrosine autokinase [Gaiellaceae bacterium]|nr:polysaccharide biosynthesis tyrosine autokinase [Gaiellaceae bacterium]